MPTARTVSMGGPRDAQARARVSVRLASAVGGSCTAAASRYSRRRVHRRACMQLVRDQRIEISLSPSAASPPTTEVILSREQRAHSRLSWAERLARNGRVPTADQVTIKLFGIPAGLPPRSGWRQCNTASPTVAYSLLGPAGFSGGATYLLFPDGSHFFLSAARFALPPP